MSYRILGAALILAGCGGFGISLAMEEKKLERLLGRLLSAVRYMESELQYRLTPLPELCEKAGRHAGGEVGKVLREVSRQLEQQQYPDAASCMAQALVLRREIPGPVRRLLRQLGSGLGCFDLPGQLSGLEAVEKACEDRRKALEQGKGQRRRSYETLGFCAGAALVILFI